MRDIPIHRYLTACLCVIVGLMMAPVVGCSRTATSGLPTTSMRIGSKTFTLEIAADNASQETGLMRRPSMGADHGMIFVFDSESKEPLTFWMSDTYIPLDIIFLNKSGTVVSVHQMIAYDRTLTSSDYPAQYAIELNRGAAESAGVHVGDQIDIPAVAKAPDSGKK